MQLSTYINSTYYNHTQAKEEKLAIIGKYAIFNSHHRLDVYVYKYE